MKAFIKDIRYNLINYIIVLGLISVVSIIIGNCLKLNLTFVYLGLIGVNSIIYYTCYKTSECLIKVSCRKSFDFVNNALVPLVITSIFGFNLVYLAIGFVLYDVLSIGFEVMAEKILLKHYSKDLESLEEFEKLLKRAKNLDDETQEIRDNTLVRCQKAIESLKNEQEDVEGALLKRNTSFNDLYVETVRLLKEYPYDKNAVPDEVYEEIIALVEELSKVILAHPEVLSAMNVASFNTYTKELLKWFDSVVEIDVENNEEYSRKMDNILGTYKDYILRLINKYDEEQIADIDVTYNVLMRNFENLEK